MPHSSLSPSHHPPLPLPHSNSSTTPPALSNTFQFLSSRRSQLDLLAQKSIGLPIYFKNLSVYTDQIDHKIILTPPLALLRLISLPLGWLSNIRNIFSFSSYYNQNKHLPQQLKIPILSNLNGLLNQGQLLLVLGRPGSGMSTFLRAISLNHHGFSHVEGHLDFGSMLPQALINNGLRPQVVMVQESDDHFASLTPNQTLSLAAACRAPHTLPHAVSRDQWIATEVQAWSTIFNLSPSTLQTPIGSATLRGISGGERKRVSVIEALLTRPSVICLDNATAGLDSLNSLQLIQTFSLWATIDQASAVIGLRQVSDQLYHLFHRVTLLYEGHQIFFGPVSVALEYFEQLGFQRAPNQPVADFLCSITDPATRRLRPDAPPDVPRTPTEFVAAFERSKVAAGLWAEMDAYEARYQASGGPAAAVLSGVRAEKDPSLATSSPWTIGYMRQLVCLTGRQYALIRADLRPYMTKTVVNLLLSLIIGSLFANLPATTTAAFSRGSVLFLSVLFNGYLQLSELASTFIGRPVVRRHGQFGMYAPSSLAIARTLGDGPLVAAQTVLFASITYGMAGLGRELGKFLRYLLVVYGTAINLTAVFRLFGVLTESFDEAMRYCGVALNVFVVCGGYFIRTPDMWALTRWIRYYVDPVSYAFEAVLSNEFHGLELQCSPEHIVPRGPMYTDPRYQTCSIKGSRPHELIVRGDDYVYESYGFEYRHFWRNLFVIFGLSIVVLGLSVLFTELGRARGLESVRLFRNCPAAKRKLELLKSQRMGDGTMLEQGSTGGEDALAMGKPDEPDPESPFEGAVLTFRELRMSVLDQCGDEKVVLDNLTGYVQPGEFTALMGESGAGKTTLLNVLAGRIDGCDGEGEVTGEVLIDGRVPSGETYKAIGYVQQLDIHDEHATVREALEFSAVLRQPKGVPKWAKLADVERVIELLGLSGLEDAIVGTPAAGLGLEDRKRLSIGVELVARPRLLCLDEPVSGMDGRSAMHIMMLLRRLVLQTKLGVVVTVHQPSMEMFMSFDRLVLLKRGGRMAFFGGREEAVEYFESRSRRKCRVTEEAGEYLIEMVSGVEPESEWEWEDGPGHARAMAKIEGLNLTGARVARTEEGRGGSLREEVWALTKRLSRSFWRDSAFSLTQLFTAGVVGMIIGLSFFQMAAGPTTSLGGLEGQVFSIFLVLFITPVVINQMILRWFKGLDIFIGSRERDGLVYSEVGLGIGVFASEIVWSFASGSLFWLVWFGGVGFKFGFEIVGFTFLGVQMVFLFQAILGLLISEIGRIIGDGGGGERRKKKNGVGIVFNLVPFFLIGLECFNGSLIRYDQVPRYWKWMYWLSPFQWYVKAMLLIVLKDQNVRCRESEIDWFEVPDGLSCEEYVGPFVSNQWFRGYFIDRLVVEESDGMIMGNVGVGSGEERYCGYCRFKSGQEYLDEKYSGDVFVGGGVGFVGEGYYQSLAVFGGFCGVCFWVFLGVLVGREKWLKWLKKKKKKVSGRRE